MTTSLPFDPSDLLPYTPAAMRKRIPASALAALSRDMPAPASLALEGETDRASLLIRFFLLGEALTEAELREVLPSLDSRDGLIRVGSTEDETGVHGSGAVSHTTAEDAPAGDVCGAGDELRYACPFQITAYEVGPRRTAYFAHDAGALQGNVLAPDHVMGIGGATRTLASLTHYEEGQSVLDLGTGCGFHAILAALAGAHVVATDISTRGLEFARFNARLNGVDIDWREGSLFEPVAGESFDVVVSNPPFVITPAPVREVLGEMEYRDASLSGDSLVETVVRGIGKHLTPAGRGYLLANWEIPEGSEWYERPESWTGSADSLLIQRDLLEPEQYVETWIRDGGLRPGSPEFAAAYRAWLGDFHTRGVEAVGFGYVLLGAADAGVHVHTELRGSAPANPREYVERVWSQRALAAGGEFPAHARLVATDVAEHRFYSPGAEDPWLIKFTQTDSFGEEVLASTELAGFVSVCDGELTAGQITAALAQLLGQEAAQIEDKIGPDVVRMVRLGMLVEKK
ncbi:methyltransferase [Arcanobacterium wilhelmae]|uniref:methyltransferase n=1 Tax=Arcanobacterium wilhelmae TaxID=1803177 RepID=UPI0024159264|nr:methyltransferase [Arcanobacterium wilhelmae]WFN90450.1 methyltransferase [Arcanobacterium wilhelmae]